MKDKIMGQVMESIKRIREIPPLVHMIPNQVTAALCADALAALGARPVMAVAPEEMKDITGSADSLVVNTGQPNGEKWLACVCALDAAVEAGLPVVLDPVGAGASLYRSREIRKLLAFEWDGVIKGNSSEIYALQTGMLTHDGVDATKEVKLMERMGEKSGKRRVWGCTGKRDWIVGTAVSIYLNHKTERSVNLVGTGCTAGALAGALSATGISGEAALAGALGLVSFVESRQSECREYGKYKERLLDGISSFDQEEFRDYLLRHLSVIEQSDNLDNPDNSAQL